MKVAIFTNNYLPNPFGVSGSIESFRKEFEKMGHTVYVFAPSFKNHKDEDRNVFRYPSIDLKFKNIRFPIPIPYSCKISRLLKKMEIDVVHAQHPNLLGWRAKHWAKKKKIPLIFTWHTLYDQYAHFAFFLPAWFAAWWAIRNAGKYANRADKVIAPTGSVKKILEKWGVKKEKLEVVSTGVDEEQLANPDGVSIREKYAVKEDEILLVTITRLTKEKNVEFLLEAVSEVLEKNKKVKFLVGGNGDLAEKLKNMATEKGVLGQVIFPGFIPNEIKKDYYAAGDIFVFASKSETQGMIISEAMYLGLPIVAVSATGVKDLVTNQVTGLLVKENKAEFIEAVGRLLNDSRLRKKFSENAGKISRQGYTSKICAQKLLEVYAEAIAKIKERKE